MTRRKRRGARAPDTVNPRPDPVPRQPADRVKERVPDRLADVTLPEAIPPRKDRQQP
jgi:hypothetical protein